MPKLGWSEAASPVAMTAYLFIWGLFTLFMYLGTLKKNKALQTIFLSLTILFILLAIAEITANPMIKTIAGIEGIFTGLSAIYLAMAEILNENLGRVVMPVGVPKEN